MDAEVAVLVEGGGEAVADRADSELKGIAIADQLGGEVSYPVVGFIGFGEFGGGQRSLFGNGVVDTGNMDGTQTAGAWEGRIDLGDDDRRGMEGGEGPFDGGAEGAVAPLVGRRDHNERGVDADGAVAD